MPRGKVTVLIGASGGGKTTVLRLIGGQNKALRGQVLFDGQDVGALDRDGSTRCAAAWACCSSSARCSPTQDVFDNVAFPLREHTDLPEAMIRDIVLMKLRRGRPSARHLMPSEVSGRHGAAVALAAIALDPELVM